MFYEQFIKLCAEKNISPSIVAEEIGLNRSSATAWKRGSVPTDATMQKLADYFGVDASVFGTKKSPIQVRNGENEDKNEIMNIAEDIQDDDDLRVLFHAAKNATPAAKRAAIAMLKSFMGEEQ